jgi:hypothetical protein
MHADADAPLADPAVVTRFSPPAGADEAAVATLLASLEESLAATHLGAIATFEDSSFAKTVSQVLAVEEQQAVVLGRAGGASIEALTPATSSTEGALQAGQPVPASGFGTDDTGGSADGSEEGNATDSGNETDTGEDDTRTDTDSGSNSADDTTN